MYSHTWSLDGVGYVMLLVDDPRCVVTAVNYDSQEP